MANKDFFFEVNQGNVAGHEAIHKFGFSDQVSTVHRHIWNAPTAIDLVWQETAAQYDIYSSSANDATGGSGALTAKLTCLKADFTENIEIVDLNGTTAVITTEGPYIRINTAEIVDNGTYTGSNQGFIRIEVTSSGAKTGDLQAFIEIDEGRTQKTQYTVPANKTATVIHVDFTLDTNKETKIELHSRDRADITSSPMGSVLTRHQWDGLTENFGEEIKANHKFEEKSDIWFGANVNTGANTIVEVDYEIILVDN